MIATRRLIAASCAVPALLLTACGEDSTTIKSPQGEVKVDRDGDKVTIESDEGKIEVGGGLAEGFPADEVPVVEGRVVSSGKIDTGKGPGFSVMVQAEGSGKEVADEIADLLTAKGFKQVSRSEMGQMSVAGYESSAWSVNVQVADTDGRTVANYSIAKK